MKHLAWTLGCLVATHAALACADAPQAEFAVRWDPAAGGPADLAATAALLQVDGRTSSYAIRYFDTDATASDAGPRPILRERVRADGKAKIEVTWKTRGADAFPPGRAADACPLVDATKAKDEVDVTVLSDGSVRRSFSRSCTATASLANAVPTALHPVPLGCASRMTRIESDAKGTTIEQWSLSSGRVILEVSTRGADTAARLRAFRDAVVAPLRAARIEPLDRSKTEIGTTCE